MTVSHSPQPLPHRFRIGEALNRPLADFYVLGAVAFLLLGFGMVMVLSSSSVYAQTTQNSNPYYYLIRQLIFLALGLLALGWLTFASQRSLRAISWLLLFGTFVLLLLTLVIGVNVSGNQNWLAIPFVNVRVQPSELAKFALIIWGADIFARKESFLDEPKQLLMPFLPTALAIIGVVVLQKDLGTATILLIITVVMLWLAGTSWRILAVIFLISGALVTVLIINSAHRVERFMALLNPSTEVGAGDEQALTAIYALASGGIWGRGLGRSRQKFGSLPEAHTDYVFAILGEELGLIGTLMIVALFLLLGFFGLRVALRSDKKFFRVAAGAVTLWFLVQAGINILMVLRWLPVIGVPLPFISYGGSALVANLCGLGVLLASARHEPQAVLMLQTRSKARKAKAKNRSSLLVSSS